LKKCGQIFAFFLEHFTLSGNLGLCGKPGSLITVPDFIQEGGPQGSRNTVFRIEITMRRQEPIRTLSAITTTAKVDTGPSLQGLTRQAILSREVAKLNIEMRRSQHLLDAIWPHTPDGNHLNTGMLTSECLSKPRTLGSVETDLDRRHRLLGHTNRNKH